MKALFLLLGLFSGIRLGYCASVSDYPSLIVFSVLSLFFLAVAIQKKQAFPFLVTLGLGFLLMFLTLPLPSEKEYEGIVVRTSENYYVLFASFRRFYVYEKNHAKELGDIARLSGYAKNVCMTNYESRFDFGNYLSSIGVRYELSTTKSVAVFENPIRLRAYENAYLSKLSEHARGFVSSLLFNRRDSQNEAIGLADSLNLVFALSSSGLLYGLFLREIEKRLKWKVDERKAEAITLAIAFLLLPLGLAKIGIRRVFLTRSLRFGFARLKKKSLSGIEATSFVGIAMLALNPYDGLQTGFALGFGISLAFSFSYGFFKSQPSIRRYFVRLAFLFLLVLPIGIENANGDFHVLSFLYSQILIPIAFLFTFVAGFVFVFSFLTPFVNVLGEAVYYLLKGFSYLDPIIPLPSPSPVGLFLYYLFLLASFLFLEVKMNRAALFASLSFLGIYTSSLLPFPMLFTDQVSFINVGQGDGILIRDNGNVVLLDTGGAVGIDMAKEVLIPFFRKERIDHIDYLIASHSDYDHIGAKDDLYANFKVGEFIDSHDDFPLHIGELTFYSYNIYGGDDENDKSLVLSLNFMGYDWVFTGDAPSKVEKKIIADNPDIPCDILKVGHHGSSTSTCAEWLDSLTPDVAIISVGRNNKYGHPNSDVMERLTERGISVRRTDLEGTITYRRFSLPGV